MSDRDRDDRATIVETALCEQIAQLTTERDDANSHLKRLAQERDGLGRALDSSIRNDDRVRGLTAHLDLARRERDDARSLVVKVTDERDELRAAPDDRLAKHIKADAVAAGTLIRERDEARTQRDGFKTERDEATRECGRLNGRLTDALRRIREWDGRRSVRISALIDQCDELSEKLASVDDMCPCCGWHKMTAPSVDQRALLDGHHIDCDADELIKERDEAAADLATVMRVLRKEAPEYEGQPVGHLRWATAAVARIKSDTSKKFAHQLDVALGERDGSRAEVERLRSQNSAKLSIIT